MSAIAIERLWRGYKVRKVKTIKEMIIENRSALKIQKWLRKQSFLHRHKFLLYVRSYLKIQTTNSIILPAKFLS